MRRRDDLRYPPRRLRLDKLKQQAEARRVQPRLQLFEEVETGGIRSEKGSDHGQNPQGSIRGAIRAHATSVRLDQRQQDPAGCILREVEVDDIEGCELAQPSSDRVLSRRVLADRLQYRGEILTTIAEHDLSRNRRKAHRLGREVKEPHGAQGFQRQLRRLANVSSLVVGELRKGRPVDKPAHLPQTRVPWATTRPFQANLEMAADSRSVDKPCVQNKRAFPFDFEALLQHADTLPVRWSVDG